MDTSNELRFNAPCYETVYCFKFKSLVFSSRVCAGAPAIPSWKFDSSNARQSVVGAERHQDLFLKVATIGFSSENNPPMLRTWLLGKETLVRTRWPCLCRTAGLWRAWQLSDRPQSLQDNNLFNQTDWPCAECFHYPGIQMAIRLISFDLKKRWMHILIDFVNGLTSFRLLRHAR